MCLTQEKKLTNERQERAARAEQMRKEREKADKRQRNLITVGIAAVVIALIAGGAFAISKAKNENSISKTYVAPKNVTKDFGIDYTTEVATGKAAKNPVKVVLYEDFQCPACQAVEQESGAYLKSAVASGDITIEYRPVSFLDSAPTDKYSSRAANVALCVLDTTDIKTYSAMHDILYVAQSPESGPGLADSKLNDLAKQAGAKSLTACINSQKFHPWIVKATAAWKGAGYTGTPTILVGGKVVDGVKGANGQT
ncbi:MAG: thioredoxin domain-containing protein, partial [Aeromicrobium sp.]